MTIENNPELQVGDLMAEGPIVVLPDATVARVAEVLSDYDIGGAPVVDASGRLVGIVSQTDLVRAWASTGRGRHWHRLRAHDVMTRAVVTIHPSATLSEAARVMHERNVARLVVVGRNPDAALGVISDSDLVRGFART
jgi:predicted transcriptional regulator